MTLHGKMVAAGTTCLIALAVLLWESADDDHGEWFDGSPWDDADWPDDAPVETPLGPRVRAYNRGRTTIQPLVSPAYIARREGR